MKTTTMIRAASFGAALLLAPAAFAGNATGEVVSVEGDVVTVRIADGSTQQFEAAPDLRIVTPAKHEIRASDLRTGEKVRVMAEDRDGDAPAMARSIVVIRDGQPASSSDVDAMESEREIEIEREGGEVEIESESD